MNLLRKALGAALLVAGCTGGTSDGSDGAKNEDQLVLHHGSVDHVGVVESATMMLASGPVDLLLDPYNEEDPFDIQGARFLDTFSRRLAQFDSIDGKTDWTAERADAWAARMASSNYLVVDLDKPCDFANPHTYLEIERALMTDREHATCGGRMPNEDALDVTINWLVRGPEASALDDAALHDGVDQATQRASDTFPYLADLNGL